MAQSVTPYTLLKQHLKLIRLPQSAWNIFVPNSLAAYLRRSNSSTGASSRRRQRLIPGRLHTGVKQSSEARGVGKLLYLDSGVSSSAQVLWKICAEEDFWLTSVCRSRRAPAGTFECIG